MRVAAENATKWVYMFGEGSGAMKDLLGGKGAGVSEMTRAGMPVPPGFTITTDACRAYFGSAHSFPAGMWDQVLAALAETERMTGKGFGDPGNPLLVSVRSGAPISMPGMMDTILNLGLNAQTRSGLEDLTGDARFALDAQRRFIQMFGKIAKGVDGDRFEDELSQARREAGVKTDPELSPDQLRRLVERFLAIYQEATGQAFPEDPREQLRQAVEAVFESWDGRRARDYRRQERIPDDLGTAVNVQMMAFGNMGENSGTGVAFTRNPITGANELYGDYLVNAQGEDVVAGIRETESIADLELRLPDVYGQFVGFAQALERHYRDIQDVEFTVERGKLYLLQTRNAKRSGEAAVNTAIDHVREGLITREQALLRVEPGHLEQLLHHRIDPAADARPIGRGKPASPGAATGAAAFDADTAEEWGQQGRAVILVRVETSPSDVHGLIQSKGVLTSTGGTASHAALVARGMGKPCIVAASEFLVDLAQKSFSVGSLTVHEGDEITIDGSTGEVFLGSVATIEPVPSENFLTLLSWADEFRRLQVWANGDYPRDAVKAVANGAEGIGLCRTEHMFMEEDRLPIVQAMIMAKDTAAREQQLERLLPIQRGDFEGILRAMSGKPVIIRLIDPPLHEFLPRYDLLVEQTVQLRMSGSDPEELARLEAVRARVEELHEVNPMLGLRGVRLSILYPEITRMQVRAIMEAASKLKKEGLDPRPEIMIPLIGTLEELKIVKAQMQPVVEAVAQEQGLEVEYKFGTMIEVPRAAMIAGEIASEAEFFSFGTNDLTQTTFGYSRDDAEVKFLVRYLEQRVLKANPFETIDRAGVGRLMALAVKEGRAQRPDLEIGICGEHGGDPQSIQLCHELGLNYVSCSPFRVPVARLAAAQAALRGKAAGAGREQ